MKDESIPKWMSASTTNVSFGHEGFLLQVSPRVAAMALEWKEIRQCGEGTQDNTQLDLGRDECIRVRIS